MIEVLNQRDEKVNRDFNGCFYHISRGKSILGNPFKIGVDGDRDEVIEKFRIMLWALIQDQEDGVIETLNHIIELEKKYGNVGLLCWCKPKRCHGDIILSCVNWMK